MIPRPVAAAQAPSRGSGRPLLLAGILGALAVLLVGGGALAFVGFGVGSNLLRGSEQNPPSSSDNQGVAPSQPEITQTPDASQEPTEQTEEYEATEPRSAPPLEVTTAPSEEVEPDVEEAAEDYYYAVDREDWGYTYEKLDSESQALFTEEEWYQKNQWYADNEGLELSSMDVTVTVDSNGYEADVTVYRTFQDGTSTTRDTVFVLDGVWKHRLTDEEIEIFMPDASYEEFVEAQQQPSSASSSASSSDVSSADSIESSESSETAYDMPYIDERYQEGTNPDLEEDTEMYALIYAAQKGTPFTVSINAFEEFIFNGRTPYYGDLDEIAVNEYGNVGAGSVTVHNGHTEGDSIYIELHTFSGTIRSDSCDGYECVAQVSWDGPD